MMSELHEYPQTQHKDLKPEYDQEGVTFMTAIIPMTEEGSWLQVWNGDGHGTVIFIPFGKIFFMSTNTVHCGGFRTKGSTGHLRLQLWLCKDERPAALKERGPPRLPDSNEVQRVDVTRYPHAKEIYDKTKWLGSWGHGDAALY